MTMASVATLITAKPGDLFQDASGAVYVVRGVIHEPSITMERVLSKDGNPCTGKPQTITGGVSGLMWNGFTILRAKEMDE